jgi:hypothetical protein
MLAVNSPLSTLKLSCDAALAVEELSKLKKQSIIDIRREHGIVL